MKNENIFLNNRAVLKISGPNYLIFLNNILTSDITKIKSNMKYPAKTCLDSSFTSTKINQEFYSIGKSLNYMKNLMKK